MRRFLLPLAILATLPASAQIKGYSTLKIVDMQVGGRSVPYMVKFNTQPLLVRNGLKVPIPNKCSLHPAAVSVKTVAAAAPPPPGESIPAIAPPTWSGADEAAAGAPAREILTTKADYLPAFLKLLNPQTALKPLVPGR